MAGRPSKYSDEILKLAEEYLDNFDIKGDVIPTVEGLALYLNIHRDTVYDWCSQPSKRQFSDIVNNVLATQSLILINSGLKGDFNSSITKLMLTKHGYSDKIVQENTHEILIPIEEVDEFLLDHGVDLDSIQ